MGLFGALIGFLRFLLQGDGEELAQVGEAAGMFFDERIDVAHAFLSQYLVDGDEDAGFLDVAKRVVDGGTEDAHRWAEAHVGIDEGRNVEAELADGAVEDAVVFLKIVVRKERTEFYFGRFDLQGVNRVNQVFRVAEVLAQEIEYHIAAALAERGIHGHFAEEVFGVGHYDGQCAEPVPEVVEGEKAFCGFASSVLVFQCYERAPQFNGLLHVVLHEVVGEPEHVTRGEDGLAVLVGFHFVAREEAVATEDFFRFGIPHDKLTVGMLARIEPVEIQFLTGAAAGGAEGDFAQAAYFAQYVGRVLPCDDVNLVVALVGMAQSPLGRQFCLEQGFIDGFYDFFHDDFRLAPAGCGLPARLE